MCSVNAGVLSQSTIQIEAALMDGARVLSRASRSLRLEKTGETSVALTISHLGNIAFWGVDTPRLYRVVITLTVEGRPLDRYSTRIGFRDARFEVDGFFLNGRRLQLFGLDRHELYPYVGYAMPPRVERRDAEILRHKFNCNIVRCSHYPQSEAFLEACDDLGLMVWEELPGWQYLGNAMWQDLAVRDVETMIRRDRNRPAVVIWGVRINESPNDPALYHRTKAAARALDDSRPTSGTMTRLSTKDWFQDVFAYDDYHAGPDGSVDIAKPLPGVPYLVTEAVGQFNYGSGHGFDSKYRRAGDVKLQKRQAILHAQAHSRGDAYPRLSGVIAWCAFDYASLMNSYRGVKCPGVADIFRIPKLGAAFYMAQVDPNIRPVIEPNFYWDFGPRTPSGPGNHAAIFSNCDKLEVFVGNKLYATIEPDHTNYRHVRYPPSFVNLAVDGSGKPELRIDGYIGAQQIVTRRFSSDRTRDHLRAWVDDTELIADGSDATRLAFQAADEFGAPRPFVGGAVTLEISGPGVIVGDNPFELAENGGAGAVWIKTVASQPGRIQVMARHSWLGTQKVEINVSPHDT
jgi:beta-galactosidase